MHTVVARFLDGRIVKGRSLDVTLAKPACHVTTTEGRVVQVPLADLKALFFVKDADGNREHQEGRTVDPGDPRARGAKRLTIRFRDGEIMVALAAGYSPERPFFFVVPADPRSNNVRILVNRAATAGIEEG